MTVDVMKMVRRMCQDSAKERQDKDGGSVKNTERATDVRGDWHKGDLK